MKGSGGTAVRGGSGGGVFGGRCAFVGSAVFAA